MIVTVSNASSRSVLSTHDKPRDFFYGHRADGLAAELDRLAEPIRSSDDCDARGCRAHLFRSAEIRWEFQELRLFQQTAYFTLHLFGSALPENCAAVRNMHRIVLGNAFPMGRILVRGRRRLQSASRCQSALHDGHRN